ncbi:hypothetical protein V8F33_012070 [Rhypophila sp. PSN 637]
MKIEGRTFVVSGGASGLGLAVVKDLLSKNAAVIILDICSEETFSPILSSLPASQRPLTKFIQTDVTSTESITSAVSQSLPFIAQTKFPLGGLIPAAGVGLPALMLDRSQNPLPLSNINFVLGVNLLGTLDLIRQFLPHLANSPPQINPLGGDPERGAVIMVSSSAAFDGQMGQVSYSASKGAVASMTLPMARDLSRFGIRVVTIAPSMFESNMTKHMSDKVRRGLEKAMEFPKRAGKPEEFSALVVHAIENIMLNGVVIRLDGATRMPSRL